MTKQEFEQLTGLNPTQEEFNEVNDLYMLCATIDKQQFCQEYKKIGATKTIAEIMDYIRAKRSAYDQLFDQFEKEKERVYVRDIELATFLIGKSIAYEDRDFKNEAIRLVGMKMVVLIKVKNGFILDEQDEDYILKNLS